MRIDKFDYLHQCNLFPRPIELFSNRLEYKTLESVLMNAVNYLQVLTARMMQRYRSGYRNNDTNPK